MEPEPSHSRKSLWRVVKGFALFLSALAFIVAVLAFVQYWRIQSELEQRLDALRAAGYPTNFEELDAFYDRPVNYPLDQRPIDRFFDGWVQKDSGFGRLITLYDRANGGDAPVYTPELAGALGALLDEQAMPLRLLYEATDQPDLAVEQDFTQGTMGLNYDRLQPVLYAMRTLEAVAVDGVLNDGDTERAVDANIRMVRLARATAADTMLSAHQSSMGHFARAADSLGWILSHAHLSERELTLLVRAYADDPAISDMQRAWAGEMGYWVSPLDQVAGTGIPLLRVVQGPWYDYERVITLRYTHWVLLTPFKDWSHVRAVFEAQPMDVVEWASLAPQLLPNLHRTFVTTLESVTRFRLARLAIAVEHAALEFGRLPPTLDAVEEHLVADVPEDVYSGEALLYAVGEDAYTVYSVYDNGVDDGGVPTEGFGDGDLVLTIRHDGAAR